MCLKGFLCKGIKLSGVCIVRNGDVELFGVKRLKPYAKTRQLSRVQLLDSLFNFFGGCHGRDITPATRHEKVRGNVRQELIPARSPGSARR
jgi:hypothetical protein